MIFSSRPFIGRWLAALIFVAMTVFEAVHDLSRTPWHGYSVVANWVIVVLAPLWIMGAIAAVSLKPWTDFWLVGAVLATFMHGIVLRVGMNTWGAIYIGLGVVLFALTRPFARFTVRGATIEDLEARRRRAA